MYVGGVGEEERFLIDLHAPDTKVRLAILIGERVGVLVWRCREGGGRGWWCGNAGLG
jgi:hypothetical protein